MSKMYSFHEIKASFTFMQNENATQLRHSKRRKSIVPFPSLTTNLLPFTKERQHSIVWFKIGNNEIAVYNVPNKVFALIF